jgi:hypothetical protein
MGVMPVSLDVVASVKPAGAGRADPHVRPAMWRPLALRSLALSFFCRRRHRQCFMTIHHPHHGSQALA